MTGSDMSMDELAMLRDRIDDLDKELVQLLARRFQLTERVGSIKARAGIAPVDRMRETAQASRIAEAALAKGLDPLVAQRILAAIIAEVVARHRAIAGDAAGEGQPLAAL